MQREWPARPPCPRFAYWYDAVQRGRFRACHGCYCLTRCGGSCTGQSTYRRGVCERCGSRLVDALPALLRAVRTG